jgi:hypothetical protein
MGAGRKTFTYDADTQAQEQFQQFRFENMQRNLEDELGGCIFGAVPRGLPVPGTRSEFLHRPPHCCSKYQKLKLKLKLPSEHFVSRSASRSLAC